METVSLTEARGRLGQLVNQVALRDEWVAIARNGKPVAVLVSPEAAEFIERIEDLIDARLAEEALEDALKNGTVDYEELAKELGL